MVQILLRLKARGIVGLSIHDGLMVPKSKTAEAKEIMTKVSLERLGFVIPVSVKILKPMATLQWSNLSEGEFENGFIHSEIHTPQIELIVEFSKDT